MAAIVVHSISDREDEVRSKLDVGIAKIEHEDSAVGATVTSKKPANGTVNSELTHADDARTDEVVRRRVREPLAPVDPSTSASLRPPSNRYSLKINSRVEFSLTDTFRIGGSWFTVTLEEERLRWENKKGRKNQDESSLYLRDVYAVTLGNHKGRHPPMSSSPSARESKEFTVYALKSFPGTVGEMCQFTFKCSNTETCQIWSEQIYHQMQTFGSRPRRLYVVVNPVCGNGCGIKIWNRVETLFNYARVHVDVLVTEHRFHARDTMQALDLAQYDGVIAVGGDGLFSEVLNGMLVQAQHSSGVNISRPRFIPVSPSTRIGIIPAGLTNCMAQSVLGTKDPLVAAAQVLLGCSTPVDVCSTSQNGQLLAFSAGPLSYGFWSDTALLSQEYDWLGRRKLHLGALKALFLHRHFEAEVSFVPMEETEAILRSREKCFGRCPKCSNYDTSLESPSAAPEKGASVMASYSHVERLDERDWKTIQGQFASIIACPHICYTGHSPRGMSPWGHLGNGCTDLIMVSRCSVIKKAKWLMKQRKGEAQFEMPQVHIYRVKEFKFRELLRSRDEEMATSVDNLVQEIVDDDELTNNRMEARKQQREGGRGIAMPTSHWNIDGDQLPRSDVEVRVHRHLVTIFGRGVEPPRTPGTAEVEDGSGVSDHSSRSLDESGREAAPADYDNLLSN